MKLISAAALALFATTSAFAAPNPVFTLDFEGAAGYSNPVLEYYNGGTDSLGQSGPDLGVSFTNAALALSNDPLGPYYSNAPSPLTVLYSDNPTATMNVALGFIDRVQFYYSWTSQTAANVLLDAVNIYSGLNGTGTLLASASLYNNAGLLCTAATPYCRFDLTSVKFAGVGKSIVLSGDAPNVVYDNISITSAVPEPATSALVLAGLLAVGFIRRRREA